ncbi:uncharacterized protein ppp1r18 [Phyllopteryx taeniolatus]|uniref:uncharacterized protein ppp1r18 n=1 Tax=Phyllopteryx taeniolatus TaxID=161469 RepID=UPI002AD2D993|nr:uncharacterized protein ppp1r18 [Phyllopteryx taeniolatus]
MSVSSLPEWKQVLLERKRREEEERERREKEEEEKFANMPAWKRGIIQRRKAKQEILVDREKERDISVLQLDAPPPSDVLSDTDNSVTASQGNEQSLSPDPSQWMDVDHNSVSQVSVETIVPVHENPFIRTQCVWRKGKEGDVGYQERGNDLEAKEREKDKMPPRGHDRETGRGRNIEQKIGRFRDLSEGQDKERSRDRSQGRENNREIWEKASRKESVKDIPKEKGFPKEENESDPTSSFSPHVPCLRTIRADNIIIIEQNRRGSDEIRTNWREMEVEPPEEDLQGKMGMKMDLREILAGGASVTEIRASDVLIIKPTASTEERSSGGGGGKSSGREDGKMCTMEAKRENLVRELRTEISWMRENENSKEKDRPCGQATVIKDNRMDSLDDNVFYERGGRVSQLLSKFGELRRPPSRSKSSDNFLRPSRRTNSRDNDEQNEGRISDGRNVPLKGVPKRSFSFSDRVVCAKENRLDPDGYFERKTRERIHADRSGAGLGKETPAKCKMGCARLLDKDKLEKQTDGQLRNEDQCDALQKRSDTGMGFQNRFEVKRLDPVERKATGLEGDDDREGFTMASVKSTEGISFAKRIPIRQDGKARMAEREMRRLTEKGFKCDLSAENDSDSGRHSEGQLCDKTDVFEKTEALPSRSPAESCYRLETDLRDCSSLLSTVADRGAEYDALSHHTEELISKIEKKMDVSDYCIEKSERSFRIECKQRAQVHNETAAYDVTPRSLKGIPPAGNPTGPLEIQIPRAVFYVAEEMARKKTTGQSKEGKDSEGGQGVERRDSWRVGKPLSRVESLREKIRQKEQERPRQSRAQGVNGGESKRICDAQTEGDTCQESGTEKEKEWETTAPLQKKMIASKSGEADTELQTSGSAFDIMQEVDVLKNCPQLPVSVLHSPTAGGEVLSSGFANTPSEDSDECLQISIDERDSLKRVEEQVTHHRSQHRSREGEREETDAEDPEKEVEGYTSSIDPAQPPSPSPPHPNSLAAMSRIYNLETVGSRSGLCLRQRNVDISSVHLIKVKPLITSDAQQGDGKALSGEDTSALKTIQLQIEQFQLKEQEVLHCQHVDSTANTPGKDKETKGPQSKELKKHQIKEMAKDMPETNLKVCPRRFSPTTQLKQQNPINTSHLRSQSPDKSLKPSDCAPTPASSPCPPSPAASPTRSPTFFSIRSASGGHVKRGATITITPKKSKGTGRTTGSITPCISVACTNTKMPHQTQQTQTTSTVAEPTKKYPAVEDIEVIGGYQNLEKSCLVRGKGTPKRGKVCFDENQLEQVCEYPSETSMLMSTPYPHDPGSAEMSPDEQPQEEEGGADGGAVVSKIPRNLGTALRRGLRVDESCPR